MLTYVWPNREGYKKGKFTDALKQNPRVTAKVLAEIKKREARVIQQNAVPTTNYSTNPKNHKVNKISKGGDVGYLYHSWSWSISIYVCWDYIRIIVLY